MQQAVRTLPNQNNLPIKLLCNNGESLAQLSIESIFVDMENKSYAMLCQYEAIHTRSKQTNKQTRTHARIGTDILTVYLVQL